jgi:digeranylgeranylglycerophospholipid reductase
MRTLVALLTGELKTCSQHGFVGTVMDHDAIVIGAGPAGLFAAIEIAKNGFDVRVLEEHEYIGQPDHCAGLLSTSGIERLGISPPKDVIQNTVSGARIFSPSGHSIMIERGKREALVVDRRRFDEWMARRAAEFGAEITTKARVREFARSGARNHKIRIQAKVVSELEANAYVIAEGSRCRLSGSLGLPTVKRSSKYPAYQYEVSGVDIDQDIVEMFYGRNVAPGFFAWIIPIGERRARVGLASRDKSKLRLDSLIQHHRIIADRMKGAKIERSLGGVVLVGMPITRMSYRNIVAVGDTAGIVKATTGGGVILGGITARVAGKTITEALKQGEETTKIQEYEKGYKSLVRNELRMMYLAQKALMSLSDQGLDSLVLEAAELGLLNIIQKEGDMDLQSRVIKRLLANPRMFLLGLRAVRYINPFL